MTPLQVVPSLRAPSDQPVDLLLECHARIRRFSDLAVRLARVADAPPSERADAARAVHRYFHVALPLHVQDEDETIRPLLLLSAPATVGRALEAMTREHETIEAALAVLLPRWQELTVSDASYSLADILSPSTALEQLLSEHLRAEEEQIFPALAQLKPELQIRIVREMRARRSPSPA